MFHVKHFRKMTQEELIQKYIENLISWNKHINLVQEDTLSNVYDRHIKDCKQISKFLNKDDHIIDVGSGAGLPGIILSILGYKNVTLCEKNYKKCIFLHDTKSKLELNFQVYNGDIFEYKVPEINLANSVLVSRAFGALEKLLRVMEKLNVSRGTFHKGKTHQSELDAASDAYQFRYEAVQSEAEPESVILNITEVRRK